MQEKEAQKLLVVGSEYTVKKIQIYDWHSDVYLEEFPKTPFNSVFFENKT